MERAALYIRVSTEDQMEYSPDAQRKQLIEYAKKNDYLIDYNYIFVDEGISGRKAEKRPAFMKMIGVAKATPKPFDVILVHKFDRFARNREDSVVYKSLLRKECGIKVVSATEQLEDDKFSIILEAMLEAMAEYYSLNLADEVKKGMFEKAHRGEHSGTLPLGYKLINKRLEIDAEYSGVIRDIYRLFVDEDYYLSDISRYLNSKNIKTKNHATFGPRALKYILQNPCYYGAHRYNYRVGALNTPNDKDEWIVRENTHEPIISKDTWLKAQRKMLRNKLSHNANHKSMQKYWLSGLLRCKHCGGSMSSTKVNGYVTYQCQNRKAGKCEVPNNISLRKVEKLVISTIVHDLEKGNMLIEMVYDSNASDEYEVLKMELSKIQKKYELANKAYLNEIDTIEEYKQKKEAIKKEEALYISKINEHKEKSVATIDKNKVMKSIELLSSNKISQKDKNRTIKKFVKKIILSSREKSIQIHYYTMG